MANDLRKLIGRNLRYTQMNEKIDNAIKQLQGNTSSGGSNAVKCAQTTTSECQLPDESADDRRRIRSIR